MLRFSRLFKPVHMPHVWKRKRKKKEEEGDNKDSGVEDGGASGEEEEFNLTLNMGREPQPEEIASDDEVR